MLRHLSLYLVTALSAVVGASAQSEPSASDAEKPKDAFIKIVNACDTAQPERWRTGLDLTFKGSLIGRDIRAGERGPIGKISFTGKDVIEVYKSGESTRALASVPATLKAGGFYTLVTFGNIEAELSNVRVIAVEEYPLAPASERPGQCRVVFLNTIASYPISLSVGKDAPRPLPFGEITEMFFSPGEVDLGIWFRDPKGEMRRLQSGLIAEAGGNYTAVIHPSAERSDRPSLFRANAAEDRTFVKESKAKPAPSPEL